MVDFQLTLFKEFIGLYLEDLYYARFYEFGPDFDFMFVRLFKLVTKFW